MKNEKEIYLSRIDSLLKKLQNVDSLDRTTIEACFIGSIGVAEALYGKNSAQIKAIHDAKKASQSIQYAIGYQMKLLGHSVKGFLISIKEELESDLIRNIINEASGLVLGDIVALAKNALQEGHMNVAAVLASAALEDALKRKAEEFSINVEGKTMSSVINALKSKSFFKGAQVSIVSSYIKLRNSSMHADWEKIQSADVSSLIGFLEPFLIEHFS